MSMRQLKITKSITNRESQSLEKYLQEIGKVDLISPEDSRLAQHGVHERCLAVIDVRDDGDISKVGAGNECHKTAHR